LGAVLLFSEAVVVGRTPATDLVHGAIGLVAWLTSVQRGMFCTCVSSVLTLYLGVVAQATGFDARPLPLNLIWHSFSLGAICVSLLSCCLCPSRAKSGSDGDNEQDASKSQPRKKGALARLVQLFGIAAAMAVLGGLGYLYGRKYIYMARVTMTAPGATAGPVHGFQPLAWDVAEKKADATLALMTPQEKHSLLRGSGWPTGIIAGMEPEYGMYTGNTPAIPRLGVPSLNMQDAANGYRPFHDVPVGSTTSWPSLLALGATWDAGLVEEVAAAIAREFRGKGANVLLGPSIQVHRTAWGGRNFEYMSGDDPYLGSVLARAYVRGVQGEGVMAVAKHWAFNEQETNRFEYNVNVDARTAWELYYPPFEAAVEEGVCAFMCAYNRVNGTHSCTSDAILLRDLKGQMGFRGFVQSDWGATYQYRYAVEHGLDQDMPGNDHLFTDEALAGLRPGAVDGAARRVLAAIYRMRLDEGRWCTPPDCIRERLSDQRTSAHRLLAAKAVTKSVVLLKNDGILPLARKRALKLAVLGSAAEARCSATETDMGMCMHYFGGGSGSVMPGSSVTPLQAIAERAQREGMMLVPCANMTSVTAAVNAAIVADVVVVVGATSATEFVDRDVFDPNLAMWGGVDAIISAVATYKPTVVLMQTPGAVMMPWLDKAKAVANLFLAGEETGTGWASLLFGDASPEGKLPIQFPKALQDTIRNRYEKHFEYSEGLFTSYRDPHAEFAFPFGHGLSYTTFEFGTPQMLKAGCSARICVSLKVTNTGDRRGAEVAQAYLEFESAAETPRRILRGFHKTQALEPGMSEEALFNFTMRDLSVYSAVTGGWVLQERAKAHFGASSADIRHVLPLYETHLHPAPAPAAPEPAAAEPLPPAPGKVSAAATEAPGGTRQSGKTAEL